MLKITWFQLLTPLDLLPSSVIFQYKLLFDFRSLKQHFFRLLVDVMEFFFTILMFRRLKM